VKEITITIAPDGSVITQVKGIKGAGCKTLTNQIEKALGSVASNKATPEMFEKAQPEKLKLGG